jgi:hypothetical protein
MAQQSTRRDRKNQECPKRLERANPTWIRSANSHTGPRRVNGRSLRPDTRKHLDYAHHPFLRFFLHRWGRPHTDIGSEAHSGPCASIRHR